MQALTFNAGDRFEVVVVSIDPTDTPQISAQKKLAYVDRYERPQTMDGWHFLTGSTDSIKALADAVGFHYLYDPSSDQYAHPSGMVILTPEGKTSRYFFGIEFPPQQIRDALLIAAKEKIKLTGRRLSPALLPLQSAAGEVWAVDLRSLSICGSHYSGGPGRVYRSVALSRSPEDKPGAEAMIISWLPYEDSSFAAHVDLIFMSLLVVTTLVTLVVFGLITWFSIRYRKGSNADRTRPPGEAVEFRVEMTWILIPFFVFLGLFIWAGNLYYDMYSPPRDGIPIYVVGKQWMWKIEHPEGQREINQLHIPAGRNIILTMTSQDVIHDFDVPAFRIKHDVLPGR